MKIYCILAAIFLSYLIGAATVRLQLFPYSLLITETPTIYQTKANLFAEFPRDVDIVFLGDSIIEGGNWQDMFPDIVIANRGISGDTTGGVLDRLDGVLNADPEMVVLMAGINDLLNGVSVEEAFSNYSQIVESLPNVYPLSLYHCFRSNCDNQKIDDFNRLLSTLPNYIELPQPTLYDDLHPDAEGYKLIAQTLRNALNL